MLKFKKLCYRSALIFVVLFVVFNFNKCDHSTLVATLEAHDAEMQAKKELSHAEGLILAEIAGQATAPAFEKVLTSLTVEHEAEPYVGRYHVSVSCQDPFVSCDNGSADFVLNLLPDGTAHRTIIHLGTITFESVKQYRQDKWSYQPELEQITLHRASGVEFFYNIKDSHTIVMNIEKILNSSNQNIKFFSQGGAFPMKAYELKRME